MKKEVHRSNCTTVIEAETDLYMATLDKKEYQGIYYTLKRQLNTKMNFYLNDICTLTDFQPAAMHLDMIDYFLTTPIFIIERKRIYFKLVTLFNQQTLIRKETLYKEGTKINYIYLVFQGEFEVTKKACIKSDSYLLQELNDIKNSKVMGKIHKNFAQDSKVISISTIGPGMLIGEEDMYSENKFYSTTVKCISEKATVFYAPSMIVFELFKESDCPENLIRIQQSAMKKYNMIESIIEDNKSLIKYSKNFISDLRLNKKLAELAKKQNKNRNLQPIDNFICASNSDKKKFFSPEARMNDSLQELATSSKHSLMSTYSNNQLQPQNDSEKSIIIRSNNSSRGPKDSSNTPLSFISDESFNPNSPVKNFTK